MVINVFLKLCISKCLSLSLSFFEKVFLFSFSNKNNLLNDQLRVFLCVYNIHSSILNTKTTTTTGYVAVLTNNKQHM